MLESVLVSLFDRYLSRYLEINAEQLSADLLSKQQILIENLVFNCSQINADLHRRRFPLPLEFVSLHVGRIQCSFRWSSLFFRSNTPAFVIRVEHIDAQLRPKLHFDDDDDQDDEEEQEEETKSRRRLLLSILERCQVELIDVQVKYSDSTFVLGVTSEQMEVSRNEICRIIRPALYLDLPESSPAGVHQYLLAPSTGLELTIERNQAEDRWECLLQRLEFQVGDFRTQIGGFPLTLSGRM